MVENSYPVFLSLYPLTVHEQWFKENYCGFLLVILHLLLYLVLLNIANATCIKAYYTNSFVDKFTPRTDL